MMDYDIQKVKMIISDVDGVWTDGSIYKGIDGIEDVLARSEAVHKFNLNSTAIGDLMVLGEKEVVFGNSDISSIPNDLRSHASIYETKIPLIGINTTKNPDYFINTI